MIIKFSKLKANHNMRRVASIEREARLLLQGRKDYRVLMQNFRALKKAVKEGVSCEDLLQGWESSLDELKKSRS
jgi:hypothetical protein